jgi:hypothetical protein
MYDFNKSNDISYEEMFIMLSSCLSGLVKITGIGRLPDDPEVEAKTDIAL